MLIFQGELNGPASITWQSGDVFEFSYKNGNMEGNAVFHSHTGTKKSLDLEGLIKKNLTI